MTADYLSRAVDKTDDSALDLEDESQLVFAAGEAASCGKNLRPSAVRPPNGRGRRRRTTALYIPVWTDSQDVHKNVDDNDDETKNAGNTESFALTSKLLGSHKQMMFPQDSTVIRSDHPVEQMSSAMQVQRNSGNVNKLIANNDVVTRSLISGRQATSPSDHTLTRELSVDAVTSAAAHDGTATNDAAPPAQLCTLAVLSNTSDLAQQQRASDDLADIIHFLETGNLPANEKSARALMHSADCWTIEDQVLYHLYNPTRRNVNTVKGITKQLAVPKPLRTQVLQAFHDDNGHYRLDKCYMTILNHYYWPGLYQDLRGHLDHCFKCRVASQKPPKQVPLLHAPVYKVMECSVLDYIKLPPAIDTLTG